MPPQLIFAVLRCTVQLYVIYDENCTTKVPLPQYAHCLGRGEVPPLEETMTATRT